MPEKARVRRGCCPRGGKGGNDVEARRGGETQREWGERQEKNVKKEKKLLFEGGGEKAFARIEARAIRGKAGYEGFRREKEGMIRYQRGQVLLGIAFSKGKWPRKGKGHQKALGHHRKGEKQRSRRGSS